MARATGEMPPELMLPVVPACVQSLYDTYFQLRNAASSTGFGPPAISLADIVAWQQLFGVRLNGWEIETLLEMDRAAREGASVKGKHV
ncbi:phage tail assembly chaperone [Chitinimonas sp. PSY-7]|uniref:phage tail assembly chaperone n=1 Tax=Chitinimonas sp. PSY-7 TaxID=3459088 RepID=UPI00403FF6FF